MSEAQAPKYIIGEVSGAAELDRYPRLTWCASTYARAYGGGR